MPPKKPDASSSEIRKVAAIVDCDGRTVRRYVRNRGVLPVYAEKIAAAFREIGRPDLVRQ